MSLEPSTVSVEGPPPGLARGRHDVPRWQVATLGGVIVALGIGYLVVRAARAARAPREKQRLS